MTEVVSWIGAALRESTCSQDSFSYSIAELHVIDRAAVKTGGTHCDIIFIEMEIDQDNIVLDTGACWHGLLKNPVVAEGFPISLRPDNTLGLEIPLDCMGLLVGASHLTVFDQEVVLKGFNAATVATACVPDESIISWHFILNPEGNRLSYSDHRVSGIGSGLLSKLGPASALQKVQTARHVLGWATKVSYNFGMACL